MNYAVLIEGPPGTFTPTGEVFDDTAGNGTVQDRMDALQAEDGICRAASATTLPAFPVVAPAAASAPDDGSA